jgi:hypothetical protein
MQKLLSLVSVVLIALQFSVPANAGKVGAGAVEIATRGGFQIDSFSRDGDGLGSQTTVEIIGGLNYSFSDLIALGGGIRLQTRSIDPDSGESVSETSVGFEGSLTFNFQTEGPIIPFAGAGAGILTWSGDFYDDAENTLLLPSIFAGMRIPVMDAASFNISLGYTRQVNAEGVDSLDANSFGIQFGFSVFPNGFAPRG